MDAAGVSPPSAPAVPTRSPTPGRGQGEPSKPERVDPVEAKERADRPRAGNDRENSEAEPAAARETADARRGIGCNVDVTV